MLNSGGANCYTGVLGFQTVHATAEAAGEALGLSAGDVLVCSTGLIGEQLDTTKLVDGVGLAAAALTAEGGDAAARAIMTTDTRAEAGGRRRPTARRSAAWRRAPACSRRASPRCSS